MFARFPSLLRRVALAPSASRCICNPRVLSTSLLGNGGRVVRTAIAQHAVTRSQPSEGKSGGGEKKKGVETSKGPVSWKSLGLIVAAGGLLVLFAEYVKQDKREKQKEAKVLPTIGQAALGGPFVLRNAKGETVTTFDLQGKFLLLYFGFTFCPDVCPNELAKMTDVINILDKKLGQKVDPVFITIDPQRDTPAIIGEYIKDYHPRFIALTGNEEQIADVTRKFRVYHSKAPTGDGPNDYLVDHSIIIFLVGPHSEFLEFYGKNKTVPEVVEAVSKQIQNYRPPKVE